MSASIDELMVLRPRISELEHALAAERRHHAETIQMLVAERRTIEDLRRMLQIRNSAKDDQRTPAMGSAPVKAPAIQPKSDTKTDRVSKRWTDKQ